MYPVALFFIAIGVYSTNDLFEVGEVLVFGIIGAILMALEFPVATILLGYVLGPLVEEIFRRALLLSRGDLMIFIQRPISAAFISASMLLGVLQIMFALTVLARVPPPQDRAPANPPVQPISQIRPFSDCTE
jgi:TctA family transporter